MSNGLADPAYIAGKIEIVFVLERFFGIRKLNHMFSKDRRLLRLKALIEVGDRGRRNVRAIGAAHHKRFPALRIQAGSEEPPVVDNYILTVDVIGTVG